MADILVVGNIGSDPELRFTPSGTAKASFSIAENRKYKDSNGDDQEVTTWHNIAVWKDLAENVVESLKKGDRVIVHGRLDIRDYETDDGEKKRWVEINAFSIGPDLRWATASVTKKDAPGGSKKSGAPSRPDFGDEPF